MSIIKSDSHVRGSCEVLCNITLSSQQPVRGGYYSPFKTCMKEGLGKFSNSFQVCKGGEWLTWRTHSDLLATRPMSSELHANLWCIPEESWITGAAAQDLPLPVGQPCPLPTSSSSCQIDVLLSLCSPHFPSTSATSCLIFPSQMPSISRIELQINSIPWSLCLACLMTPESSLPLTWLPWCPHGRGSGA